MAGPSAPVHVQGREKQDRIHTLPCNKGKNAFIINRYEYGDALVMSETQNLLSV